MPSVAQETVQQKVDLHSKMISVNYNGGAVITFVLIKSVANIIIKRADPAGKMVN
jgi:hypothetical protein